MKNRSYLFVSMFTASLVLGFGLGGCTSSIPVSPGGVPDSAQGSDGPHASDDRQLAAVSSKLTADGSARVSFVDFSNFKMGGYSTPVRGVLVTPQAGVAGPAPLIIFNHLRYPNCSDGSNAYPCVKGASESRLDRGMTWFGEFLARSGYATLILDLSGVWVGADLEEPYSQPEMWAGVVEKMLGKLEQDNSGEARNFGSDLKGRLDLNKLGLVVHSRAGGLIWQAQKSLGEPRLKSVLAYGPSYTVDDPEFFSPAPPDVPYLAVTGDADGDVGASANLWLANYLSVDRGAAALSVQVPGFGHTFINRVLQKPSFDDRKACDLRPCQDAKAHEALLGGVASDWFDATIRGRATTLPLSSVDPLPREVAGVPARWLAVTAGQPGRVKRLAAEDFTAVGSGSSRLCRIADPMVPQSSLAGQACPAPEVGVVSSASELNVLTAASAKTQVKGAKMLVLHLAPFGGASDGKPVSVRVILSFAGGGTWSRDVDPGDPVLADLKTDYDNGSYLVGSVRVPLDAEVAGQEVTAVTLQSAARAVALRGADLWY